MKTTIIKCDYCKVTIEKDFENVLINGKGYFNILLTKEPSPEVSGRVAILKLNLRDGANKNLERDICYNCLARIISQCFEVR